MWLVLGLASVRPYSARATDAGIAAVTAVDTLVVTAAPLVGPGAPTTASLVTRLALDDRAGLGDLTDLLGRVAGLQVARLGGWGTSAVPSLRGSAAAQIRFFVDGMPLPDAPTGLAGFERIPLDRLQAVEVHRGLVPAALGDVGGAGAINLITRPAQAGVEAKVQCGAFGQRGGRVSVGSAAPDDSRSGLLMVHGHRADNDFAFSDHNQTFHRTDDDTVRMRRNAWIEEWGAWGAGRWTGEALAARGSLGYTRRDGGRPGPLGFVSERASVRYGQWDGQLHLAWEAARLQADIAAGRSTDRLHDPEAEVGFLAGTSRATSDDLSGRLAWSPVVVPARLAAETGLAWRGQWQTETMAGVKEPERRRRTTSAFAAVSWAFANDRLRITPAWRWQHTHDNFHAVPDYPWLPAGQDSRRDEISPSVGVVCAVAPGQVWLESHLSRTVRTPTWLELFGQRGGLDGNHELLPEEITAVDLAVNLRRGRRFTGRVALFWAETADKIIFVQNSQRTSKARNFGRTRSRGAEAEVSQTLSRLVVFSGNLTAQRVEDRGDDPFYHGKRLPFLSDLEIHARLTGDLGGWRPWLMVGHRSANYRDRANTELNKAPARTHWNLGCQRDWHPRWLGAAGVLSVMGEVANLTDNTAYDVEGFPLPGRSWQLAAIIRR